jgi:hypothetical protein
MKKFYKIENETEGLYIFHCPGCHYGHVVRFRGNEPVWQISGIEEDKATVNPSLLVNGHILERRCHSFIRDGKIQFLADCFHELAGKTVDIPDFDEIEN